MNVLRIWPIQIVDFSSGKKLNPKIPDHENSPVWALPRAQFCLHTALISHIVIINKINLKLKLTIVNAGCAYCSGRPPPTTSHIMKFLFKYAS